MLGDLFESPLFLASVLSSEEAQIAIRAGAQIIDCKDPANGPLGALSHNIVREIVKTVARRVPTSATVGNIVLDPQSIHQAVIGMASTGVDFVKIGLFKGGDTLGTIHKLANIEIEKCRIVAVLFAEDKPDFSLLYLLSKVGFSGVMLDTSDKQGKALPDLIPIVRLKQFVDEAHSAGLFVGLAGSLRLKHLQIMLDLKSDLLGFRGALCKKEIRGDELDENAVLEVASKLEFFKAQSNLDKSSGFEIRP